MRIIAGTYRGRPLVAPPGQGTRPTADRTRESMFNILAHRPGFGFAGARVIDLFAGSGALGFEALSRGAGFCLLVETAAAARAAIRDNQEALGLNGVTHLHRRSATELGPKPAGLGGPFTLAFLDPPYAEGLVAPALEALISGDWLAPGAMVVIEQHKDDPAPALPLIAIEDERRFGETLVLFGRSAAGMAAQTPDDING